MTADQAFHLYRSYKFFYSGRVKFKDGHGVMRHPPLLEQRDRRFFYRIAQKLDDPTIHALYTIGFFYNPTAYVSDLVTPEAQRAALLFAGRGESVEVLQHDLYELGKRLSADDVDAWLYGELDAQHQRAIMPGCLQAVVSGELGVDLAAALLLIPRPELQFDWVNAIALEADVGLGAAMWVDRLRKADQLINMRRTGWRLTSRALTNTFWQALGLTTLAPHSIPTEATLF